MEGIGIPAFIAGESNDLYQSESRAKAKLRHAKPLKFPSLFVKAPILNFFN